MPRPTTQNVLAYAALLLLIVLAILGKSAVMLVSVLGMELMYRILRDAPLTKRLGGIALGAVGAALLAEVVHTLYHRLEAAPSGPGSDQGGFFVGATLVGLINAVAFVAFLLLLEWFGRLKRV